MHCDVEAGFEGRQMYRRNGMNVLLLPDAIRGLRIS